MLDKALKNGLYKTLDARPKDDKSPFMETGPVLTTHIPKNASKTTTKPTTGGLKSAAAHPTAASKTKKAETPVWHLATFSSPEQLAQFKEKQVQAAHESMLRAELAKFRAEVEDKFRNSPTNRGYIFPRNCSEEGDTSESTQIIAKIDCIFCGKTQPYAK